MCVDFTATVVQLQEYLLPRNISRDMQKHEMVNNEHHNNCLKRRRSKPH